MFSLKSRLQCLLILNTSCCDFGSNSTGFCCQPMNPKCAIHGFWNTTPWWQKVLTVKARHELLHLRVFSQSFENCCCFTSSGDFSFFGRWVLSRLVRETGSSLGSPIIISVLEPAALEVSTSTTELLTALLEETRAFARTSLPVSDSSPVTCSPLCRRSRASSWGYQGPIWPCHWGPGNDGWIHWTRTRSCGCFSPFWNFTTFSASQTGSYSFSNSSRGFLIQRDFRFFFVHLKRVKDATSKTDQGMNTQMKQF